MDFADKLERACIKTVEDGKNDKESFSHFHM